MKMKTYDRFNWSCEQTHRRRRNFTVKRTTASPTASSPRLLYLNEKTKCVWGQDVKWTVQRKQEVNRKCGEKWFSHLQIWSHCSQNQPEYRDQRSEIRDQRPHHTHRALVKHKHTYAAHFNLLRPWSVRHFFSVTQREEDL